MGGQWGVVGGWVGKNSKEKIKIKIGLGAGMGSITYFLEFGKVLHSLNKT